MQPGDRGGPGPRRPPDHELRQAPPGRGVRALRLPGRAGAAPDPHRPALRGAWLATIVDQALAHDYDGINLDFETGAPTDRAAFTSFVTELAARLHGIGKKLAVDVSAKTADDPSHPRSGLYDYPAIAAEADIVFVMAWGIHWATSEPGPIADMPWLRAVVHYVNTLPDREKYVMGTPLYGMDWPRASGPGAPAKALEWADVVSLSARVR